MKAWGFFRDEGRLPDERQIQAALVAVGHRHVVLDREHGTVRFDRPGVELDLGGIGKGYAVDRVVELLRRRGIVSALVNLGGSSVYGLGAPPGAEAWEVGIQDPSDPGQKAVSVTLRDRALSVSGSYARSFEKDGVTYAHVMDPRTGRPVQGVLSVAVLSADATGGDALDNVLFVQGLARARAFLASRASSPATSVFFFLPAPGTGYRLECLGAPSACRSAIRVRQRGRRRRRDRARGWRIPSRRPARPGPRRRPCRAGARTPRPASIDRAGARASPRRFGLRS